MYYWNAYAIISLKQADMVFFYVIYCLHEPYEKNVTNIWSCRRYKKGGLTRDACEK